MKLGGRKDCYLDEESTQIYGKMERGDFSKVVNQAMKEWGGGSVDVETARLKIKALKDNIEQEKMKLGFWEKKVKILEAEEKAEREKKEKEAQKEKKLAREAEVKQAGKQVKIHKRALLGMFEVSEAVAEELVKEYLNSKHPEGFKNYFIKKGLILLESKKS